MTGGTFVQFAAFFTLINFNSWLKVLLIDFATIVVLNLYVHGYQHHTLGAKADNIRVVASTETNLMLRQYMELRGI